MFDKYYFTIPEIDYSSFFQTILNNQTIIMATTKQLAAQVDGLQASLDAKQAQIMETINGLKEVIATLEAEGGTAEERQELADKLTALKADLESTNEAPADVPVDEPTSTENPEAPEEPEAFSGDTQKF